MPRIRLLIATRAVFALIAGATSLRAQSVPTASTTASPSVVAALRDRLRPIADSGDSRGALPLAVRRSRVIAIGEATHGQHEVFDLKRRLTLELIRTHGVRVVAYEASASLARSIDAYIADVGSTADSADLAVAMQGFGMLIWQVEENAALLRDLRAYNRTVRAADRVRFIGVDAQDGEAVGARVRALLASSHPALVERANTLLADASRVTPLMFNGQRAPFDSLSLRANALRRDLDAVARTHRAGAELRIRALELTSFLTMWGSPGGRDRAMAELLLVQLQTGERAVLLAHNAHVGRGALTYLNSRELAMGGHLAARLGAAYYPVGVAFGEGEFQANVADSSGRWFFRRYHHGAPPTGFFEEALMQATSSDAFIDFRGIAPASPLGVWLRAAHPIRWWGGYQVPADPDAQVRTNGATRLTPEAEYAGMLFVIRTTAATPRDRARIVR